ncbi:hypothetical protein P8452_56698 [Trifolium repens]|nr:hypothetical protein P8452_56698 [Trifolium repens]
MASSSSVSVQSNYVRHTPGGENEDIAWRFNHWKDLNNKKKRIGEPEEELVFENDDLTWDQVANASGVNEPIIYTRRQRENDLAAACASKERMTQQVEEEGVEEIGEDVEDNEVEADGDYDEEDDFEDDS